MSRRRCRTWLACSFSSWGSHHSEKSSPGTCSRKDRCCSDRDLRSPRTSWAPRSAAHKVFHTCCSRRSGTCCPFSRTSSARWGNRNPRYLHSHRTACGTCRRSRPSCHTDHCHNRWSRRSCTSSPWGIYRTYRRTCRPELRTCHSHRWCRTCSLHHTCQNLST